jgi:YrbI family 3-deoxy-D-manno-octulosonate 8-phosphate phosphatase
MHYLFTNIKYLLQRKGIEEEDFYSSLGFSHKMIFNMVTGHENPTPDQLIIIADKLKQSLDTLLKKDLRGAGDKLPEAIKMLVLDVDGVLTDGGMYLSDGGLEIKKFNTKDGMAIKRLVKNGIAVGMLSHGYNRALVKHRADMLGVQFVYTGQERKEVVLKKWMKKLTLAKENIAYIGDDINDLDVIAQVGFSAAPADAVEEVKVAVSYVLTEKGGQGCVREFAEIFLKNKLIIT